MGTKHYMASELQYLKNRRSEENPAQNWEKTDIFSLGVLLFILRFGNIPFESADQKNPDFMLFMT
jgi:serine/threonine protein kinase